MCGDTPTLEGGFRSTDALKIIRVRSPANNRLSQKDIRTPRRSSPLVALFLRSSSRLLLLLVLLLALNAACNHLCYFASTVFLTSLLTWVGPDSSRVPFYLVGDIVRTNTFRGRTFRFPRDCGLLPLPLLGHGTCHWVHRG